MYVRVSVVSEVGTRAPTPLEVTQPQNITEIRLFSSWHTKSGLYFSFLISSKYQIIDHSYHNHGLICEKKGCTCMTSTRLYLYDKYVKKYVI